MTASNEGNVVANIERKEADAERMAAEMVKHMADISSEEIRGTSRMTNVLEFGHDSGANWDMYLGDVVENIGKVADDQYLNELTSRTYDDIIASGNYSYRRFTADFDALLASFARQGNQATVHVRVVGATLPGDSTWQPREIRHPVFLPARKIMPVGQSPEPDDPPPVESLAWRTARRLPECVKRPIGRLLGV